MPCRGTVSAVSMFKKYAAHFMAKQDKIRRSRKVESQAKPQEPKRKVNQINMDELVQPKRKVNQINMDELVEGIAENVDQGQSRSQQWQNVRKSLGIASRQDVFIFAAERADDDNKKNKNKKKNRKDEEKTGAARDSGRDEKITVKEELRRFREGFGIEDAKRKCRRSTEDQYSVAIATSGGCLCTLAAIRAGFHPIWGSEIEPRNGAMFEDLTASPNMGDATQIPTGKVRSPTLLKTSFPCQDYCPLGSQKGNKGKKGGELFVWQGKWICRLAPDVAVLEQTVNAMNVNGGKDLEELTKELEKSYVVHTDQIRVWRYGDVSNRTRLIMVCVHKRHGLKATHFKFPHFKYDEERYPTAADIAQPDFEVPSKYILNGEPKKYEKAAQRAPKPGTMHSIARFGDGAGDRERPNAVQSNMGLPATQLTSNGCSRRTMLSWRLGEKIDKTRLTTPAETLAIASLHTSYGPWAKGFANDGTFQTKPDEFLVKCVNNGVPLATGFAVDTTVAQFLEYLGVKKDVPATHDMKTVSAVKFDVKRQCKTKEWQSPAVAAAVRKQYGHISSMLVDTGAQLSCSRPRIANSMKRRRESHAQVGVAKSDAGFMQGLEEGTARVVVMNTESQPGYAETKPFEFETTTFNDLNNELFSFDDPFRNGGWNMALRQHDYEDGTSGMFRPAKDGRPEERIPFRYDWEGNGGFYIDYACTNDEKDTVHVAELMKDEHRLELEQSSEKANTMLKNNSYTPQKAAMLAARLMVHPVTKSVKVAGQGNQRRSMRQQGKEPIAAKPAKKAKPQKRPHRDEDEEACIECEEDEDHDVIRSNAKVAPELQTGEESFLARHEDERAVKGTKAGMPHGVNKMKYMTFHRSRGHCGNADDCDVCKMVKGNMRRITKKIDPHRETREMYAISMDMVVMSHRSVERSKYMITLRDQSTGWFKFLYLYLKSDAPQAIKEAILELRADPMYGGMPYEAVQRIHTDEAGEWGLKSEAWKEVKRELKIEVEYRTPETSKPLGHAEKTNSTAEVMIKSIMFEENLPKDHWQAAARGAEFLLNRFANIATDTNAPVDGDYERPLEKATRGRYSRRQIDKELAYYVQPGRVALVHQEKVKGSQLQPKVRWGIAWGMYKEQVIFKCPYKGSTFRSKSFTAYELSNNMNYFQFLGLPYNKKTLATGQLARMERSDKVDIHLPTPRKANEKIPKPPVIQQQTADDAGVVFEYAQDTANGGNGSRAKVHPQNELKGHVRVFAPNGKQMVANEKGILCEEKNADGAGD